MLPPKLAQLIHYPFTSATRAVWLFLKELKIPCTFIKMAKPLVAPNLDQSLVPDIEAMPAENFPVFIAKGIMVSGVHSILRYLCQTYVTCGGAWYPVEPVIRSKVDMYLEWHQNNLQPLTNAILLLTTEFDAHTCVAPTIAVNPRVNSMELSEIASTMKSYLGSLNYLENFFLASNPYLAGDFVSIADIVAAAEIALCKVFETDLTSYPRLLGWFERMQEELVQWPVQEEDYTRFHAKVRDRQDKKKAHAQKIKKHGKDAAGGNRAPDVAHTVLFHKPLDDTFTLFTSSPALKEWTKSTCHMLPKPGGTVSLYDQRVLGTLLYIEKKTRLLMSWRFTDWGEQAPPSTVRLNFQPVDSGTLVTMEQSDVPVAFLKKTDQLWNTLFWKPSGGVLVRHVLQQHFFDALTPHEIYEALTDTAKCSRLTNKRCEINRGVGAEFSYLDGAITGKTTELIVDMKIGQLQRMPDWQAEHYSKVSLQIERVAGGTCITHSQRDVPVHSYRMLMDMWERYFWRKLHALGQ
eukprot:TRINITY_DN26084_c0_g1_i1.p1 TRINITY_DN26084_c0_g1~~TRINITY_DN26084_c0_g1_i1.p1  ORF type:complete len:520 (+),score=127.22 TRINITY_DN26084_c0_g1_i1:144-1703(+)